MLVVLLETTSAISAVAAVVQAARTPMVTREIRPPEQVVKAMALLVAPHKIQVKNGPMVPTSQGPEAEAMAVQETPAPAARAETTVLEVEADRVTAVPQESLVTVSL